MTSPAHLTEGDLRLDFVSGYDSHGQRRWSGMRNGDTTQPEYYVAYNHKRERTVRSIRNNGASWSANAIQYVYDEASHLIGEYKSNGTPIVEYVWKGDVPVAAIYGPTSATKIYYIVTDAQNTPRRLIDSSNNAVVWAWDSTAFGVAPPSVQTVKFNLRFPGQYYDEITKQHYNLNRYYNPEIGRYMEPDPTGLEAGLNPYSYASNNPVNNVDPTGLIDFNFNFSGMNLGASLPSLPDPVYQGAMGFANGASLGLGQPISNWVMGYQTANVLSPWYTAGELTSAFAGGAGFGKAALQTAMRSADNFINSTRSVLPEFKLDKWIRSPSSIQDQMTLTAVQAGEGRRIISSLSDSNFKGMEKWEFKTKSNEGLDSVVHYVRDPSTSHLMDFKFTKRSVDGIGQNAKRR